MKYSSLEICMYVVTQPSNIKTYYYYSDAAVDVGKTVYKWDILKAVCLKVLQ